MRKTPSVRKLVLAAMLMAMVTAMTMFVSIKVPGPNSGYIHPGDAMIYASAWLLGGPWGAVIGGLGSALADLLSGYATFALGTLIIKAAMGLLVGYVCTRFAGKMLPRILAMSAASLLMVLGYFLYELVLYGYASAIGGVPFNLVQAVAGVVIAEPFILVLHRVPQVASLRK